MILIKMLPILVVLITKVNDALLPRPVYHTKVFSRPRIVQYEMIIDQFLSWRALGHIVNPIPVGEVFVDYVHHLLKVIGMISDNVILLLAINEP